MVDFSKLVLAPALRVFGVDVTVDPVTSRPGQLPYKARMVFSSRDIDVQLSDGNIVSDQLTTFGIRLSDFGDAPPAPPGDVITRNDTGVRYIVADSDLDGQGGAVLTVRILTPDYPR